MSYQPLEVINKAFNLSFPLVEDLKEVFVYLAPVNGDVLCLSHEAKENEAESSVEGEFLAGFLYVVANAVAHTHTEEGPDRHTKV